MKARILFLASLTCILLSGLAAAIDRPVAQPPHGRDEVFVVGPPHAMPPPEPPPPASFSTPPACPLPSAALTLPAWNARLASRWLRVALEHKESIAAELQRSIHHFAALPSHEEFEVVFGADASEAQSTAIDIRNAAATGDSGVISLLALTYAAREQRTLGGVADTEQAGGARDYVAIALDVRRRVLVGITRYEVARMPEASEWIDDPKLLLAKRTEVAPLVGRVGFAVDDEIKSRPEFLACVAIAPTSENVDYDELRKQVEIIARNALTLDAFLRFAGVDLDATLKWYARRLAGPAANVERVTDGVSLDRLNHVAYLDALATTFAVHLDTTSRDPIPDFAALVWDWENGGLGNVSRAQMEALVQSARRAAEPGPFAETLEATLLDLRTHYAPEIQTVDWSRPRVGRWERSLAGRNEHNTLYELQLDTHGSYAVPGTEAFITKRLDSPIGMLLAVTLRLGDLPQRALDAFAHEAPTLHIAFLPEPGLSFDVFSHARTLTRQPGVQAAAAWNTPMNPPPASGWEIRPFGTRDSTGHEDAVLIDVRPLPSVSPGEARSFGFHVCLLTPLEVKPDGTTIRFVSPIWREVRDVPVTARFALYRREAGSRGDWVQFAGAPLPLTPGPDYPYGRVSPITAASHDGVVEFTLKDLEAPAGRAYEYRVVHRCALKPDRDGPSADAVPGYVSVRPAS